MQTLAETQEASVVLEAYYGLIGRLASAFDECGLDYAFTGALAASFYGIPRTTVDVDVAVVDAGLVSKVVTALRKARLVVDEGAVERVLSRAMGLPRLWIVRRLTGLM